jgi:hypothetical protein
MSRGRVLASIGVLGLGAGLWWAATSGEAANVATAVLPKAEPAEPEAAAPKAATPRPAPSSAVSAAADAGLTPMPQRVAVIGLLNKRNGETRDLTMKPGEAFRVGEAIVRLRACERTAPWEQDQLTGAFLQLDVQGTDRRWRRVFSGWTYKEQPALNVVQHGIYDVWPKSCTMSFPAAGPDTVSLSTLNGGGQRSSARKSPVTSGAPETSPANVEPSAEPSNAL